MNDRSELIAIGFSFLETEYNFTIVEKVFDPNMMGNSYVDYLSNKVIIEVVIDRNQVLLAIGKAGTERKSWFDFSYVLRYFAPSEEAYVFFEKNEERSEEDAIILQLEEVSNKLHNNCKILLNGDISAFSEIAKIEQIGRNEIFQFLYRKKSDM